MNGRGCSGARVVAPLVPQREWDPEALGVRIVDCVAVADETDALRSASTPVALVGLDLPCSIELDSLRLVQLFLLGRSEAREEIPWDIDKNGHLHLLWAGELANYLVRVGDAGLDGGGRRCCCGHGSLVG